MKKLYMLASAIIFATAAFAQSFTTNTNAPIRDNQYTAVPVVVTGLPAVADSSFGLCSVTFSLVHTYVGDLDLWLISPSNDSTMLTNNQGGGGNDFTNTVFIMSATTQVQQGAPPYSGSYIPEMSLNNLNDGQDPNGTWYFAVKDEAPADTGHVVYVTIEFCQNPPPDPPTFGGPCAITNGAGCYCPDSTQICDLLPDMTASGDIITNQHTEYPGEIRISNATPNIGWGPMEIHASDSCRCDTVPVNCDSVALCPNGQPPTIRLLQRIYHKNGSNITSTDVLTPGTMVYHPTHGHVHVNNWAEFTLRQQDLNEPNATHWPIIARGSKVSFCLINLGDCTNNNGYCRDSLGNVITMADIPNAPFGVVSGCGLDQGIYTGMLDIYSQGLSGQDIDLTNVCNGNYYIVSITDPDNNFLETNDSNNWAAVPIAITMQHNPLPATPINLVAASGLTYTFSFNNTDVTSWTWNFGDGGTDTLNNPATHTYAAPGTYTVTVIMTNPCGSITSTQVIMITGMEEQGNFSAVLLKANPNPADGTTTISFMMPESGAMQLEVYNLLGERVAVLDQGSKSQGWHNTTLDFDALGLSNGAYFIRLVTPAHYSVLRVIKN